MSKSKDQIIAELRAEIGELRTKFSRKGKAGPKPKHNFASEQERQAYYNARRPGRKKKI